MKTVLGILYFCLCIGPCQLVAVYAMCGQTSSNMSGCCLLSQGALRCTEVTCPDGYYNVVSSSKCSDSQTSLEDNEAHAQKETTVTHSGSGSTLAPSLSTTTPQSVSGSSKDDMSANQSDSDAASFKPLTSEAPRHLLESTSQKAPPFALMAEDNSSNIHTSLSSVTSVTSPHVFCCQCHVSCLTCSNKGPEYCLSCAPGFDWISTNTTKRCLSAAASSSSPSLFYLLIILIILPISLCLAVIVYIYHQRRQGNSMNYDFEVNMPFMKRTANQKICDYKVKTLEDVFLNDSLASIDPTLSPHKHCLVPQDEDQQIRPLGVELKYECDLVLTANTVLSRRRIEDVPRRVQSLCSQRVLGCEAWKSQSMIELRNRDSMKSSSQPFTTEERSNSTIANCSIFNVSDIESEPLFWDMYASTGSIMSRTTASYMIPLSPLLTSFDSDRSDCLLYEQTLVPSAHEILNKDTLSLPSPIISPQWQISKDFSRSGGVLKVASSSVCLEIGEGAVDIADVVTIRGAVSTDLTNAYDLLPLPEDEVIVSPIAEYFAGFRFRFEKPVRIVLPHFLSSDLPVDLVRVYEFHSENGRIQCCRLQMINTEDENPATTGYLFCGSNREIHVFTNHFSGYVCTVCEEACTGYYKPPEVTLQALAKHVLRCNGKREVIVRLDLWDSRFFSPNTQQSHHQTDGSIEDRQMVLILGRKLKSLDDSPDVGNTEIGARFQLSEEQTIFWSHVSSGGVNVFPIEQRLRVKELYPCRQRRSPYSMKWMLRDAQPIPPQEEFECFIHIGYIDGQIPIGASSLGNDQQTIIFMKSPDFLILPIRRAMKLDEDHPDYTKYDKQSTHGCLAEARPAPIRQSENTRVKNLASWLQSSTLDSQMSSAGSGCGMMRHQGHSGHVRELSDTPSANPVSIQHVKSINSLNLYVNCSTTPTRDEALGDLVFRADSSDTQERHSSLRNSVNHNMTYPTPASDQ